jgi:membrane-bound serine protease (ClpP class)
MTHYILPIALQILGVLVIVAEIFIPSFGLLTALALGIFAGSLYLVFTTVSSGAGMIWTGADLVLVPLLMLWGIRFLAASPLALKTQLSSDQGVVSLARDTTSYLGCTGVALTDLRPSGAALINESRVDVITDGEYIEAKTLVRVTGITGSRIMVEKQKRTSPVTPE